MKAIKQLIIISLTILFSTLASADYLIKRISYQCDQENKKIIISYEGAYGKAGDELLKNKTDNQWGVGDFITMKDINTIGLVKVANKTCKIDDMSYQITITDAPANRNIQGQCGACITSAASIYDENGKSYLKNHTFEDFTAGSKHPSPITTKITFDIPNKTIHFKEVESNKFGVE